MKYSVSVSWTVGGTAVIEATNEQEAKDKALDMPLDAFKADYCADSFQIDELTKVKWYTK